MDVLLQTKLLLPPAQENLVLRQRLVDQLQRAAHCRLVLVSAPAGFGKSTLLASWLQQRTHAVAWLALDELDDEPLRFWRYVTAALATVVPDLAEQSREWFHAPDTSLSRTLPSLLINALASCTGRLTLILDDYHVLSEPSIHQGIDFLLDHLPAQCQLVISSRVDPPLALPRLRARNQLCEVRTDDLRFGHSESARFLRERMGLLLDERDIQTLDARTEGWVAALQFTGLSLQKLAGEQAMRHFINQLTGRDRHVVDYLMTEVLDRQTPALQHFLLHTSILGRLSAPLCNAVLESDNAHTLLATLERANLFVVALDNERQWYRYHHLFAELLRNRLKQVVPPAERAELHTRAYRWYRAQGMVDLAVTHALAGGEQRAAAELLTPQVYDSQWRPNGFLRIRRWADRLDDAVLQEYPRLLFAALEANLLTFRAEQVERYLFLLETHAALPADVRALLMNTQANLLRIQRANTEAKQLLRDAMTTAPEDDFHAQLSVKQQMAILLFEMGEVQEGTAMLHEVVDLAEAVGHLFTGLITGGYLSLFMMGQGRLHEAEILIRQMLAKAEQQQIEVTVTTSMLYIGLSILYYEWNDLAQASLFCERGLAQSELMELGDMLWQGYQMQAQIALYKNDVAQLTHLREKAKELLQRLAVNPIAAALHRFYDFFEADIALRLGDLEAVATWATQYPLWNEAIETDLWFLYELYIRFILAQHDTQQPSDRPLASLLPLLQTLIHHVEAIGMEQAAIRFHNLLAQCYWRLADKNRALDEVAAVLQRAAGEGYIRTFLDEGEAMYQLLTAYRSTLLSPESTQDGTRTKPTPAIAAYLDQLLNAFAEEPTMQHGARPAAPSPAAQREGVANPVDGAALLPEALTEREREVLQLVVDGLTNQEIADRLVISLGTVKRHISNIYGKMGVSHRTQAVAQAQALQLVAVGR
ncbi:MAG: AAA family ATPase [Caldilineaceae bacterium]|nr:AAA family ATPase [Caldilineaceae bacterium]